MTTTEIDQQVDKRTEYIAGLRLLAQILEANPHLPSPDGEIAWPILDDARATLAALIKAVPGTITKDYSDGYFRMRFALRGLQMRVWAIREEVCTRVVTGTTRVTKTVPAPDAPTIQVTETVETVEWICEPILADAR